MALSDPGRFRATVRAARSCVGVFAAPALRRAVCTGLEPSVEALPPDPLDGELPDAEPPFSAPVVIALASAPGADCVSAGTLHRALLSVVRSRLAAARGAGQAVSVLVVDGTGEAWYPASGAPPTPDLCAPAPGVVDVVCAPDVRSGAALLPLESPGVVLAFRSDDAALSHYLRERAPGEFTGRLLDARPLTWMPASHCYALISGEPALRRVVVGEPDLLLGDETAPEGAPDCDGESSCGVSIVRGIGDALH